MNKVTTLEEKFNEMALCKTALGVVIGYKHPNKLIFVNENKRKDKSKRTIFTSKRVGYVLPNYVYEYLNNDINLIDFRYVDFILKTIIFKLFIANK